MALTISLLTMFSLRAAGQGSGGRLEGTWNVQVSIRNCQTGAEIRKFASLTAFMFGGTLLDSTSGIPQALKTPGHGVWNHLSGDTYRFSFKHFTFDPAGNFTGWVKITHDATLDPSGIQYTSAGIAQVYDPNGNLIATGCSTTTASRFD
jgi:hypothetical protein